MPLNFDTEKYDGVLVCGDKRDSPFDDNMYGHCDGCGKEIMWRPHSPHGPRMIKLCPACGEKGVQMLLEAGEEPTFAAVASSEEELFRELSKIEKFLSKVEGKTNDNDKN